MQMRSSSKMQRKVWKAEEDAILKELYEEKGIKKWSEISKIMEKEHGIEGRNGKQCRERYQNHLKQGITKEKWTDGEEEKLLQLHQQHGNRWALISRLLPGRTENCVKNQLYSRLRKSVRHLNRFSSLHHGKEFKPIKISFIYRLIDFTEHCYAKSPRERTEADLQALKLKNTILTIEYNEEEETSEAEKQQLTDVLREIGVFKRVNQRFRGKGRHRSRTGSRLGQQDEEEDEKESIKSERSDRNIKKQEEEEEKYVEWMEFPDEEQLKVIQEEDRKPTRPITRIARWDSLKSSNGFVASRKGSLESLRGLRGLSRMGSIESNFWADPNMEEPIPVELDNRVMTPVTPFIGRRSLRDPFARTPSFLP